MPTMKSSGDLIASISADLADNNAGLISAEDVRHNMEDIAFSINRVVASGDTDVKFPFYQNVRAKKDTVANAYGQFIPESGILFPNAPVNSTELQVEPWLGTYKIDHNQLSNLAVGDVHTQYYALNGARELTANFKAGNNWVNASGTDNVGFKFVPVDNHPTQEIYVSGSMRWGDNSTMDNAKGAAKAWCNFNASGNLDGNNNLPYVRSYHNISGITRLAPGKLKITFTSGTFRNNDYVCFGQANGRITAGSQEDFAINTVGITQRTGNDGTALRSCTFLILNEAGEYVDSEICDFVAYGYEPLESSGVTPNMLKDASYSE